MNLIKNLFFIILLSTSFTTWASDASCPIGKRDDHLKIQQVMMNFGKYIQEADGIAMKDKNPNQIVIDAQLTKAIDDLKIAQACADAVIANPSGDLLPDSARSLQGPQLEKLVSDLVMFMQQLSDGLTDYQLALTDVLNTTPEANRNYHEVYKNYKSLDDLVNRAHRETSLDTNEKSSAMISLVLENTNLESDMKQIGNYFIQIKKTVTIAGNNSINADAASKMSTLFSLTKNFIPDAIQNLPADQRAAAITDYQSMIQQEIDLCNQLATALNQNNNAIAVKIVQQMNSLKMDGHDRYNP
jgi:hypothetical protein